MAESFPQLAWRDFLKEAGAAAVQEVNVVTPSYFEGLQAILQDTPVPVWQQYLRFKLIDAYAPLLPATYVEAHFNLHSKELAGVPQQKPRWKRAIEATSGAGAGDFGVLGDVVGRMFVQRHFRPEAKTRMDQLVQNLLKAYEASIRELSWMTPTTQQRAMEKLAKFTTKIGYPEKWRDYSKLQILRR